jgi:anionic cell wall polymer biosynthesis LytR-Cps2A-Psr (LCP) family protein
VQEYSGYRVQKRRSSKRKQKRGWRLLAVVAVVLVVFVVLGAAVRIWPFDAAWDGTADGLSWLGRKVKSLWPFEAEERTPSSAFLPEGKKSANYLLVVTKQVTDEPVSTVAMVASYDSQSDTGSLVYLPNDLLVNVPGLGMDQVNNLMVLDEGRIGMTLVTVQNLLGIEIDRYVLMTDRDVRIMLNQMGPDFVADIGTKTTFTDPSLGTKVDLDPGVQEISGSALASYLTYAPAGKEIELCKRDQEFTSDFLPDSPGLADPVRFVTKNADLLDTDASNRELQGIWETFARLGPEKLEQGIIPVKEFKFEQTRVHRVDQEELPAFIRKYIKTESSKSEPRRIKLEILNGNGVPGVGEDVAARLDMQRFQVINSANADNFEHPDTVVLVYEDDEDVMSAAEEIVASLETGRVELRPRTQDISEITIIVGKDYAQK